MRTRTKGVLVTPNGDRTIEKEYRGKRIYKRLGQVSQEAAEAWLRSRQQAIDNELAASAQRTFGTAAGAYLTDCERRGVRSLDLIAYHIGLVLPYVGNKPLEAVHSGSLQAFIDSRLDEDEVKPATVNRTLEVVRSVLTKAARVWRDDDGRAWLPSAPLIELLDTKGTVRQPRPISWDEQRRLLAELPTHLVRMALFAVNTGLRDENICGLRWQWERKVPELGRSVFVIPAAEFKSNRPHVVILNDAAASVIEACRGGHPDYVFVYRHERKNLEPDRVDTINNTSWKKARVRAGLEQVRVHDLRHTFGQRLRAAGVGKEDRDVLMGHAPEEMSDHYATPTVVRLVELANLVAKTRDTTTLLRVVNG